MPSCRSNLAIEYLTTSIKKQRLSTSAGEGMGHGRRDAEELLSYLDPEEVPPIPILALRHRFDGGSNSSHGPAGITNISAPREGFSSERTTNTVSGQHRRGENPSLNEEHKRMLLEPLKFDQINARQMTIKKAHAKTCNWLLKKPEYLNWLDVTKLGEHHGFLWIKGKPGAGKSTIMKFAHADARTKMKDRIVISFFFNARGVDLEKSTIGMYRSLLLQLLEGVPELRSVFGFLVLTAWSSSGHHQWNVESLKELFEQAIKGLGQSALVCFIDALDECDERQIRDMISFFQHVGEAAAAANIQFQVCFSSRHYPHITVSKGLSLVLEGQEGHSQDITKYVASELEIGHSKLAEQIRGELQDKASGVFMWVVLVVEILNKEYDRGRMKELRKKLQDIPGDLHELFRDIIKRDRNSTNELLLCIQWVLFARQPLTPEQLYFAILSSVEPEPRSEWDSEDTIKRFILDSSKGLAEITRSNNPTVQFIHESVTDFLLKENGFGEIWPDFRSNFQGQSHERLKQCCFTYMNVVVSNYLDLSKPLPKASSKEAADFRLSAAKAFPFLEYAERNVLYHADAAEGSDIAQGNFIQSFQLECWIKLDNLFEKHEVRRHTPNATLLYILAETNMSNLIKIHPSIQSYLEVEDERYGLPLFASLATGSKEAVQTFLEAHTANQSPGSLPHELRSQFCQDESRQGKLGRSFKYSDRRTILSYLAELGDKAIFSLVLKAGKFMPDSKDGDGRTPLWHAVINGHEAVVKLLLETGKVDIDSKDKDGRTALSWAAGNGNETPAKLLLETGKVDVDSKDKDGRTPLSWAVGFWKGFVAEGLTRLLLETGKADVDSKDKDGRTPLSWAAGRWPAWNGNETLVKLLLETGKVDVDSKDKDGRTPLSWAAESGNETPAKLLLETGKVNVDLKDKGGRTPLSWAARHKAVVKLLQLYLNNLYN